MWKRELITLSLGLLLAVAGFVLWKTHDPFLANDGADSGGRAALQTGSRAEAAEWLQARIPPVFAALIVNGQVSDETAGELYQQHGASIEILDFRYSHYDAAYDLKFRLRWNPDKSLGSMHDFWVLGACRLHRNPQLPLATDVEDWSPDYRQAFEDYLRIYQVYEELNESNGER